MLSDARTYEWLADQKARGVERPAIYRAAVRWREFPGDLCIAHSDYSESLEEAERQAKERAIACGWTEARWWQFWRWGEQ